MSRFLFRHLLVRRWKAPYSQDRFTHKRILGFCKGETFTLSWPAQPSSPKLGGVGCYGIDVFAVLIFGSTPAGGRTLDTLIKSQVLYQLSYKRINFMLIESTPAGGRTLDTLIKSQVLYQLSYKRIVFPFCGCKGNDFYWFCQIFFTFLSEKYLFGILWTNRNFWIFSYLRCVVFGCST